METCSGVGVELRPWGKNDKDLLLLMEGSSHFRRCLVQLRGLISHLILLELPVVLKTILSFRDCSTSAAVLSPGRR